MADGSLVVSPVSGATNRADIGTKRPNVNRMKALMFLLGMFDTVEVKQKHIPLFIVKKLEELCSLSEGS